MISVRNRVMWMMGLLTVGVAVVVVGVLPVGTAAAAMRDAAQAGPAASEADGRVANSVEQIRLVKIWSGVLTVGEWESENGTVWGYLRGGDDGDLGDLSDKAFSDRGTRYVVEAMYHAHLDDNTYMLGIATDTRLRSDLILEVDGVRYLIEDSAFQETDAFFQVWELESSLEWEEGETMTVKLLRVETFSPCKEGQQAKSHAGG